MANLLRGGKGRPLHPALVHFPIALYPTSLLLDGISYLVADGNPFVKGAFTLLAVALVVSFGAAVSGFADFLRIPAGSPAWRLGVGHMTIQLVTGGLFVADAILRARDLDVTSSPLGPVILSAVGVVLLTIGAQLGSDLVYRHGVRVEPAPDQDPRAGQDQPPTAHDGHPAAHQ